MIAAKIILFVSLGAIVYQDIKQRAISWLFLPIIFLALCYSKYEAANNIAFLNNIVINSLVLAAIFLFTYLYFVLRKKVSLNDFLNNQLGIGDILFFVAITPYFEPIPFLIFILFSQFFILIGYLVFSITTKEKRTIPLAGIVSLFMVITILFNQYLPKFNHLFYEYGNL